MVAVFLDFSTAQSKMFLSSSQGGLSNRQQRLRAFERWEVDISYPWYMLHIFFSSKILKFAN